MNLKQALKRIEELERKVRELEARPREVHHYHHQVPQFIPAFPPPAPQPSFPLIWCDSRAAGAASRVPSPHHTITA